MKKVIEWVKNLLNINKEAQLQIENLNIKDENNIEYSDDVISFIEGFMGLEWIEKEIDIDTIEDIIRHNDEYIIDLLKEYLYPFEGDIAHDQLDKLLYCYNNGGYEVKDENHFRDEAYDQLLNEIENEDEINNDMIDERVDGILGQDSEDWRYINGYWVYVSWCYQ